MARTLFAAGAIVMAAHATLLVFNPLATFPSNLFVLMYPLLGFLVCLLGAYNDSPETRPLWLLLACGLLLAVVGQVGLTYYDFATNIHTQTQAFHFDFFFFAYGIPVMLAICSRSTDAGLKVFALSFAAATMIQKPHAPSGAWGFFLAAFSWRFTPLTSRAPFSARSSPVQSQRALPGF